jgi:hypothetical protein
MKSLVAVYDFNTQPISYGDYWFFLSALRAYMILTKAVSCSIFNCGNPANLIVRETREGIHSESDYLLRVAEISSMASLIPGVDRIEFFSDVSEAISSTNDKEEAHFFPAIDLLRSGLYLFYAYAKFIKECNFSGLANPWPEQPTVYLGVARKVLKLNRHKHNISINLRLNPNHGNTRNSNLAEWEELFRSNVTKDCNFYICCSAEEFPKNLLGIDGVFFAKSFGQSVLLDMAFIRECDLHLGSSSGLAAYALTLDSKISFIFNPDAHLYKEAYVGLLRFEENYSIWESKSSNHYMVNEVPGRVGLRETVEFGLQLKDLRAKGATTDEINERAEFFLAKPTPLGNF